MVRVGQLSFGESRVVVCGPCVIESEDQSLRLATSLRDMCDERGLGYVFKASFDKANRSRVDSFRGPGIEEGLRILSRVRDEVGVPVTTDVHLPEQAAAVAEVVDLLQVPAFLCRQTDLLVACGATGKPVNVKKGQFLPPGDMRFAIDKVGGPCMVTERGTTFGHGDLVVDMRGIVIMKALGVPVMFDATHSLQRPGGGTAGGNRDFAVPLARAALAAGADALFAEVHADPDHARSDAATQLPLAGFGAFLDAVTPAW